MQRLHLATPRPGRPARYAATPFFFTLAVPGMRRRISAQRNGYSANENRACKRPAFVGTGACRARLGTGAGFEPATLGLMSPTL